MSVELAILVFIVKKGHSVEVACWPINYYLVKMIYKLRPKSTNLVRNKNVFLRLTVKTKLKSDD